MGTAALAALAGALVEAPKLPVNDNVRAPFVMTAWSPIKASEALFPRPQRLGEPHDASLFRIRFVQRCEKVPLTSRKVNFVPQHGMPQPHPTCVSARSRRSM